MNVLYIATAYPPSIGGGQRHLHELARRVILDGHEARVAVHTQRYRRDYLGMTTIRAERPAETLYDGVPVHRLGLTTAGRALQVPAFLTYYPSLGATLRWGTGPWKDQLGRLAEGVDVIHGVRIGREFIYRAGLDVARARGVPFVLTPCHHPRWKGPLYRHWDRIYREADAVIALTEAERETLIREKGVNPARIAVTGIGPILADPSHSGGFREKFGIAGRFVLCLGQQLRYKGIQSVVDASQILAEEFPDVSFVFAGPRTPWSKKVFAKLDRRAPVVDLGPLSQEDKTGALMACEGLCLPSSQESFGGVYVEAWACERPVIGLRTLQTASVIDHGVDGLLAADAADVGVQLRRLLSNPEEGRRMGEKGSEKVRTRYRWSTLVEKTLDVYRSLMGHPLPGRP